jgi:hypothetical protein
VQCGGKLAQMRLTRDLNGTKFFQVRGDPLDIEKLRPSWPQHFSD